MMMALLPWLTSNVVENVVYVREDLLKSQLKVGGDTQKQLCYRMIFNIGYTTASVANDTKSALGNGNWITYASREQRVYVHSTVSSDVLGIHGNGIQGQRTHCVQQLTKKGIIVGWIRNGSLRVALDMIIGVEL